MTGVKPVWLHDACAQVNAELRAEGRCWVHNGTPAVYVWHTAIGNQVPLCAPCCAAWRASVEASSADPPVAIEELGFVIREDDGAT